MDVYDRQINSIKSQVKSSYAHAKIIQTIKRSDFSLYKNILGKTVAASVRNETIFTN